jgi:hypothetical protein
MSADLDSLPLIHIHRPRGYYIGQVRLANERRWTDVTGRCTRAQYALAKAVQRMGTNCVAARALFVDTSGYYDPAVAIEARKA